MRRISNNDATIQSDACPNVALKQETQNNRNNDAQKMIKEKMFVHVLECLNGPKDIRGKIKDGEF